MFSFSAYVALFGVFIIYKTFSSLPEGAPKDTMTNTDWGIVILGGILIVQYFIKITIGQDRVEKLKRHLNTGIKLKDENDLDNALEELNKAVILNQKCPGPMIMYLERAKTHLQLGNRALALNDLKTFIQMAANTPSLEEQISEANNMMVSLQKDT